MHDDFVAEMRRRWTLRFGRGVAGALSPGAIVKVVGRVRAEAAPRNSPLGGRESVLYTVRGSRAEGSGKNRRVIVFADEEWFVPFWVEREKGRVRIEPEAWFRLLAERRVIANSATTAANLDAFAARYGLHERDFFDGFGGASYVERSISPGDIVAVIGTVHDTGMVAEGGYRESQPVYALRPPANGRLWISSLAPHIKR
ncbi:MAG: hypothetical protein AB8I08_13150 [Sandaracinaceae bacterium]